MSPLPFIVAESLNEFLSKGAIYKLRWQDDVGKWYTVAYYRPSTFRLQLKTLLPCILDLTPAIELICN